LIEAIKREKDEKIGYFARRSRHLKEKRNEIDKMQM
jgi:hypothetical protein